MNIFACLVVFGFWAIGVGAYAQTEADAPFMVRADRLMKLTSHIQIIPDIVPDYSSPQLPNVGFVVGTRAVLVIETGLGVPNGAIVFKTAEELARGKPIYLVTTHIHPEHDLGAQAFSANTKMIRSRDQQTDIAEQGYRVADLFRSRSKAMEHLLQGAVYRPADITFDQDYFLDLGGVTARLMALGPNHTLGDTAIWIETDRVLFSGDTAMKAQPAVATPKATLQHWQKTLDTLEALHPKIVVPSHGPIGDVDYIRGYRAYLDEVGGRTVAARNAGLDLPAAIELVTKAMIDRYPDTGRLAGAVKMAYGTPL